MQNETISSCRVSTFRGRGQEGIINLLWTADDDYYLTYAHHPRLISPWYQLITVLLFQHIHFHLCGDFLRNGDLTVIVTQGHISETKVFTLILIRND